MADENNLGNGNGEQTGTPATETQSSQTTSPPQSTQQTQRSDGPPPFIADLRTALDALPEKVANAIAEAMPKPASTPPAQSATRERQTAGAGEGTGDSGNGRQTAAQRSAQQTQTPPGRKNFREWWAGVPAGTIRD